MNHLNYNCSVYNLSVVFWCTDMQFWYVHPVNIPLYVDHADCVKGTLPSVEKGSPRREDTLCSLALKSSASAGAYSATMLSKGSTALRRQTDCKASLNVVHS